MSKLTLTTRASGPLAIFLATAVVVANLASLGHALLAAHRVCDEHGEVTHQQRSVTAENGSQPVSHLSTVRSATDRLSDHEHGCSFLVHTRAQGVTVAVACLDADPPACTESCVVASAACGRAKLILTAPKTSPPLVLRFT